jgi:hypothetical protein
MGTGAAGIDTAGVDTRLERAPIGLSEGGMEARGRRLFFGVRSCVSQPASTSASLGGGAEGGAGGEDSGAPLGRKSRVSQRASSGSPAGDEFETGCCLSIFCP